MHTGHAESITGRSAIPVQLRPSRWHSHYNIQGSGTVISHSLPPNVDENITDQLATSIERKSERHPEQLPAQLLQTEFQGVPDEVLSQLPLQPGLVRAMQRIRQKEVLPSPMKLWYLKEIHNRYNKILLDEQFLLHDSDPPPQPSCIEDANSKEE